MAWRCPTTSAGQKQVDVYVTILDEQVLDTTDKAAQGQKMAAALEELARLPVRSISDPLEWEREQRQERTHYAAFFEAAAVLPINEPILEEAIKLRQLTRGLADAD